MVSGTEFVSIKVPSVWYSITSVLSLSFLDKSEYTLAIAVMKKRFALVDIDELRGMEFHSLTQENQSVEQVGIELQKLAHKAFPSLSGADFDRLLKGRQCITA